MSLRILVLSAGDGAGINFCNSLKLKNDEYYIIGTDTNVYRISYATADEKHLLPDPESKDYWPSILNLIEQTKPDFIYAADTNKELELMSANRETLKNVRYFLPSRTAVAIYEDKWLSYQHFEKAGITVPKTRLLKNENDVDNAIYEFGHIWLRATRGSGGKGSLPTNNPALAKAWIDHHNAWGEFTAAEVLSKQMATWIGIWMNGDLAVCQGRKRLHWEYANLAPSGVTGITGAQSTTNDPAIHEIALKAIQSIPIKPHGIVSVDLTYDKNGVPNPTEIQGSRFYSSIYFLAKAGLNLADIFVQIGMRGEIPSLEKKEHPLPNDLIWLKAVDCMPQLITAAYLEESARTFSQLTTQFLKRSK